jgi:tRNA (cmo5U34)-methyltransferase
MLEKMDAFFESRLDGYDEHMMTNIAFAGEFYPFTARQLPAGENSRILDLGCGTGLELESYFLRCPSARVTGIDLSQKMLDALKKKFPDKEPELIVGSYFDVPFGTACFDAAVSVESLHHFTLEEKVSLYGKLHTALKEKGYFILTDYFSLSEEEERGFRQELIRLKAEQGVEDGTFCHFDTPLTVEHETQALREAGFSSVEVLQNWGATYTLKAVK